MVPRVDSDRAAGGRGGRLATRTVRASALLRGGITRAFAIDRRALAALRIALGLVILADLGIRSVDLVAFYTDAGVLPRAVLREQYGAVAALAFGHGLSGAAWVQWLLFGLAGAVALALVAGYRTRSATVVSFLLLVSLSARNPLVLNAGDTLLLLLLFWGMFLPLGARWSVDAVRGPTRRSPLVDVATVAVLVQVLLVYVVNAVVKLRGDSWRSGQAIRLVFELDHLTVRLGDALAGVPLLVEALGWVWFALLLTSPLLVILTGWPRAAFAGLFAAMHLGMFLTMRLGLFPFVSIAGLLPFVPPRAWDALERGVGARLPRRLDGAAWRTWIADAMPAADTPRLPPASRAPARRAGQLVAAVLLITVLVWNAASLGYVDPPQAAATAVDPEERRWDMFAPEPRRNDGWYVVPGRLESGGTADAFHGGPVRWDRPPDLARAFPSHRWFLYLLELSRPGSDALRAAFADYLCRRWNAAHDDRLESLRIVYLLEPVRLDGTPEPERIELGRYACGGA